MNRRIEIDNAGRRRVITVSRYPYMGSALELGLGHRATAGSYAWLTKEESDKLVEAIQEAWGEGVEG